MAAHDARKTLSSTGTREKTDPMVRDIFWMSILREYCLDFSSGTCRVAPLTKRSPDPWGEVGDTDGMHSCPLD